MGRSDAVLPDWCADERKRFIEAEEDGRRDVEERLMDEYSRIMPNRPAV